jgi:hypothetical protein
MTWLPSWEEGGRRKEAEGRRQKEGGRKELNTDFFSWTDNSFK